MRFRSASNSGPLPSRDCRFARPCLNFRLPSSSAFSYPSLYGQTTLSRLHYGWRKWGAVLADEQKSET